MPGQNGLDINSGFRNFGSALLKYLIVIGQYLFVAPIFIPGQVVGSDQKKDGVGMTDGHVPQPVV